MPFELGAYIQGLPLPHGGTFDIMPWERRFLRGIEATAGDAALSVARGNGKSGLLAGVAAAVVDPAGPWHGPRFEVTVAAATFDQATIIFEDALCYLGDRYDLEARKVWRKQMSKNAAQLDHRASGARLKCIGNHVKGAHGARPRLVLADEPAQWEHADAMHGVLRTGLGKVPGSRLIALGTRPADEGHWFAKALAGGYAYVQVHAADVADPPFQRKTWRKANPSLDAMPDLEERIRAEADDAKKDPSLLANFQALRCNTGTSDTLQATLLDAGTWEKIEGEAERIGGYVLGIDLGSSAAMSAAAGYWPESGRLEALACFPRQPGLSERGLRDGVGRRYLDMARRGELIQCGEHAADVDGLLGEVLARWGAPAAVVCDRWRIPELREALEAARVPAAALVQRGQGFKDGGEDVRDFRQASLRGRVVPSPSLLMRSAMGEARVTVDPAGNSKLGKGVEAGRRLRARDDAAAAGILAVAAGHRRYRGPQKRRGVYRGMA